MYALAAFVRLGRPHFLAGGFIAFGLGAAVARFDGVSVAFAPYLLGQATITAFQLMVHYANDYYDRAGDAFATRTLFSGGSGVLVAGHLPARVALQAAAACGALGTALVVAAALDGNVMLAAIGTSIGLLSWAYSAPPLRLVARGFGELDTVAVVALLVPLAGYAAFAHAVALRPLLATLPGACAMFALMLCVELPDAVADAASGKRNLVVRLGSARALAAARVAGTLAVGALCVVLIESFSAAAWLVAAAATVPALVATGRAAFATPLWGVTIYATIALAALVAIVTA